MLLIRRAFILNEMDRIMLKIRAVKIRRYALLLFAVDDTIVDAAALSATRTFAMALRLLPIRHADYAAALFLRCRLHAARIELLLC